MNRSGDESDRVTADSAQRLIGSGDTSMPAGEPNGDCGEYRMESMPVRLVCSVLGVFLIGSVLALVPLRIGWDIATAGLERPIGTPGIHAVGMISVIIALPIILTLGVVYVPIAFAFSVNRCQSLAWGTLASVAGVVGVVAIFCMRELRVFVPASAIGLSANSSWVYYSVAVLQMCAGIWLLRRPQVTPDCVSPSRIPRQP